MLIWLYKIFLSTKKTTDITFTVKRDDLLKTIDTIENNKKIEFKSLTHNDKVSKIMLEYDAKDEENEYANINNIKDLDKYAITGPTYCKPLIDNNFNNSVF